MFDSRRHRPSPAGMLLAAVVVAIISLLAACGGDDGNSGNGTATPTAEPGTATPSSARTPAPTAGPGAGEIEKLSAEYLAGVDGKIVYDFHGASFGTCPDGTWTVYIQGDDRRQDWKTGCNDFEATTVAIDAGRNSYVCTIVGGIDNCSASPHQDTVSLLRLFTPVFEVMETIVNGYDGMTLAGLPAETYAGVTAQCFDVSVPGRIGFGARGTEQIKVCFSSEGALLYLKRAVTFADGSPSVDLIAEAIEVGDTTASDFEPIRPVSQ